MRLIWKKSANEKLMDSSFLGKTREQTSVLSTHMNLFKLKLQVNQNIYSSALNLSQELATVVDNVKCLSALVSSMLMTTYMFSKVTGTGET